MICKMKKSSANGYPPIIWWVGMIFFVIITCSCGSTSSPTAIIFAPTLLVPTIFTPAITLVSSITPVPAATIAATRLLINTSSPRPTLVFTETFLPATPTLTSQPSTITPSPTISKGPISYRSELSDGDYLFLETGKDSYNLQVVNDSLNQPFLSLPGIDQIRSVYDRFERVLSPDGQLFVYLDTSGSEILPNGSKLSR